MRVLVGISGGLDSAAAAVRLMELGHEVEGAVVVMHEHTDVDSAREVARSIGIRLHIIDAAESFELVKRNFVSEYSSARTPNPCVLCNPQVKFASLIKFAKENGFDKIATGHYARIVQLSSGEGVRYALARGRDTRKDQTYMLSRLSQSALSMLIFPLGESVKTQVREMAENRGLAVASKKESQEICFIPDGDYAAYIEREAGVFPEGDFLDSEGRVLGRHKGIIRYTVGQRKGLGISAGERVFVSEIRPDSNTIVLRSEASRSRTVRVRDIVFSGMREPIEAIEVRVGVKLRYLSPIISATASFDGEGGCLLTLDEEAVSVTPGQSAVMYDGDTLLASGFILQA